MTNQTRARALSALKHTLTSQGKNIRFTKVFVVGDHIFFTFMAAYRQYLAMMIEEDIYAPIEIVWAPTADRFHDNMDQRGDIMPGEVFPSDDYAEILKRR